MYTSFHNMDSLLSIERLIKELDEPNSAGWKLFMQTSNLSAYRPTDEDKKSVRYKSYTHIPDITPEICYKVALDMEYRLVWDKYLKEARKINDGEKTGVYLRVAMPLFKDNRDYTFVRNYGEYDIGNRHFYYVVTHSEQFTNTPPQKKVVRVDNYQSQTLICSDGSKGFKSIFIYGEVPRKRIPKAIWTWAAKFGIPLFAKLTDNACRSYPEWIKDKKIKLPDVIEEEFDTATAAELELSINDSVEQEDE